MVVAEFDYRVTARHCDVRHFYVLVLSTTQREVNLGSAVECYCQDNNRARHVLFKVDGLQDHVIRIRDVDVHKTILAPICGVASGVGVPADLALEVLERVRLNITAERDLHLGLEPRFEAVKVDKAHTAEAFTG